MRYLHCVQSRLEVRRKGKDDPAWRNLIVVRRDFMVVINQHDRRFAAQLVTVDHKVIAGENQLVRQNRRGVVFLRLKQLDHRTLEGNNLEIAGAHRKGRPDRALAFYEHNRSFVNRGWPILRLER